MPMVALCPSTPARAWPLPNRMCIVESNQSGAIRRVQRQRIAEAVWPFRRHLGLHHDELHPVTRIVHEEGVSVKVQ